MAPRTILHMRNSASARKSPEYCGVLMFGRSCDGAAGSHVSSGNMRSEGLTMSYNGSGYDGGDSNARGVPPHAFDPNLQPELFRGVLTRRVFAFLIDLVVLSVPVILEDDGY